jgi:methionyl-tRNA formyltransferase
VNAPEYVRRVRAFETDVLVSVAAPEIFEEELLAAPRVGAVNCTPGGCRRTEG